MYLFHFQEKKKKRSFNRLDFRLWFVIENIFSSKNYVLTRWKAIRTRIFGTIHDKETRYFVEWRWDSDSWELIEKKINRKPCINCNVSWWLQIKLKIFWNFSCITCLQDAQLCSTKYCWNQSELHIIAVPTSFP